jgi:L-iditol 2-dehydrogenase
MKAAILTGIRQFEIREVPDPQLTNATDVLIRVKTVGVCGSDIHYYATGRIGPQKVEYPFIVGHEASGVIEQVGKKVSGFKPGDRIAIDPALSCGRCDQCKAGREHTCRKLRFLGCPQQLGGCLCEYIVLPQNCCYPIGRSMTFEEATLSEPLAIGCYTVERAMPVAGSTVAILGVGPIGMSVFQILRTEKVESVYVTDKIAERLAFSRALRPRWSGNPDRDDIVEEVSRREPLLLDTVYECSGDPAAIVQGIRLLKPGGKLVIVGITETDEVSLPIHELRRREISILNIRRQVRCTQKAIDLIAKRKVRIGPLVTHRFRLEDTQKAFALVANHEDGVMKAIVDVF